jgi:hypothetical protein
MGNVRGQHPHDVHLGEVLLRSSHKLIGNNMAQATGPVLRRDSSTLQRGGECPKCGPIQAVKATHVVMTSRRCFARELAT